MTQTTVFPADPKWEGEGTSRIPFWAYTREDLYKKELDQFFYKGNISTAHFLEIYTIEEKNYSTYKIFMPLNNIVKLT